MRNIWLLLSLLGCWLVTEAQAGDIEGTVTEVESDTVQITTQSEMLPNVGDPVTVFFKIPGTDDEILVGSGRITAIRGDVISAKLEKAMGKPQKDQLVRITSEKPQSKTHYAPASPESEVPPAPHHFANDYAHLLKPETLARLNATLADYERQTSNQFLLAIFERLPASKDESAFALEAFRAWKPGLAGVNNGAILFVFVQNRTIRISVGRGLEQALPNDGCKHIISDIIAPAFKAGNFDGGVVDGMQAMMIAAKDAYHGNGRTHTEQMASPNHP